MIKQIAVFIGDQKKKKFLAVKRAQKDDVLGGMWALPGGAVEEGETFLKAAKREIKEETGLELVSLAGEPSVVSQVNLGNYQATIHLFKGEIADDNFSPQDSDIEEVAWITPREIIPSLERNHYPKEEIEKLRSFLAKEGFI